MLTRAYAQLPTLAAFPAGSRRVSGIGLLFFMALYPYLKLPFVEPGYVALPKVGYLLAFSCFFLVWSLVDEGLRRALFTGLDGLLVACLFVCVCLATVLSLDPIHSLIGTEPRFLGLGAWFGYIALFLGARQVASREEVVSILQWFVYASIPICLEGVFQHFYLFAVGSDLAGAYFVKSWGFVENSNHFGSYLVLVVTAAAFLYFHEKIRFGRYGLVCMLAFLALVYSGSKAGWIGAFVGFGILSVFVLREPLLVKRWVFLAGGMLLVLIVVDLSEDHFVIKSLLGVAIDFGSIFGPTADDAGAGRWGLWKESAFILQHYWPHGTGPGMFREALAMHVPETRYGHLDNSHNEILEIALTLGVPAVGAYLGLIGLILWKGIMAIRARSGSDKLLSVAMLALVTGYLVKVMFNVSIVPVGPFFFVILGMASTYFRPFRNDCAQVSVPGLSVHRSAGA